MVCQIKLDHVLLLKEHLNKLENEDSSTSYVIIPGRGSLKAVYRLIVEI